MKEGADLTGQVFGRLTVVAFAGRKALGKGKPERVWKCRCTCGTEMVATTKNLRKGNTQSCGCLQRERTRAAVRKHGMGVAGHEHPLYGTWKGLMKRCNNLNHAGYMNYGGRGISVCQRWRDGENGTTGFECFLADVGSRPTAKHSLDRINNDGNYEPGNVRWATRVEQNNNRRDSLRRRCVIPRAEIPKLRAEYATGQATCKTLADRYAIGVPSMWAILAGKSYRNEPGPIRDKTKTRKFSGQVVSRGSIRSKAEQA